MGVPGPPELGQFLLESELWKRLGRRLEELEATRSRREVDDILTIIQLVVREENARAKPPHR